MTRSGKILWVGLSNVVLLEELTCILFPQSVDFHEKGKKHQENVKRKIEDVSYLCILFPSICVNQI